MEYSVYDYLAIVLRRKKAFFFTFVVVMALATFGALNWSKYRSTATIQVVPSDIPEGMTVPAGMNAADMLQALVDQRITQIQQVVTSTSSMVEIITKFDLYHDARQRTPISDIAAGMAEKVKLEMVGADFSNPAAANKLRAGQMGAIAFMLSFDYGDPLKTQQVTNELVSRFLDEDLKQRRGQVRETLAFLEAQLQQLENAMLEQERKIAEFRDQYPNSRPESLAFNRQMAATTALNIQGIQAQLGTLEKTRGDLRAQLSTVDPYSRVIAEGELMTTPATQLKVMEAKLAAISGQYGPRHPDVVKLTSQIEALRAETRGGGQSAALEAQLADARAHLAQIERTYGPSHPDVRAAKDSISALEARLSATSRANNRRAIKEDADNPAYLMLVAQMNATDEQVKSLQKQMSEVQKQHDAYEAAVAAAPAIEQEYAALTRDYDNAQARYRELKAKKQVADMSAQMEQDRKAQRLSVINPPEVPTRTRPPRSLLLLGGFLFAVMSGFAAIVVTEVLSRRIHGAGHLAAITGYSPLVIIPHIYTVEERRRRRNKYAAACVGAFAAAGGALIAFDKGVMPLDLAWTLLSMRLGIN